MIDQSQYKKHIDLVWTIANLLRGPYPDRQFHYMLANPEPDPELRDTENVPLPEDIQLPLPLDYENKKTKGKLDKSRLLALVQSHCEAYLKKEVLPYRLDAWIDHDKIKVGYEIPFNRHFYKYQPPRPLEEIEADIKTLEKEIMEMLGEVTRG